MINKLNEIDLDIKRCETVLIENDYLEVVIAIEELHDKYKNTIEDILKINSKVVWNYSKKDIEYIKNILINYKEELIFKENQKTIQEKIKDIKNYIENKYILEKDKLIEVINNIENINNKELDLDIKWDKLKKCLELIKNQEREIGSKILELIVLISK